MKYKVLKEFVDPRTRKLMKPGDMIEFLYEDEADSYRGTMIKHGFIEEIKDEPWAPKEDEEYWMVTDDGAVTGTAYFNSPYDAGRFEIGNCFQTAGQAEKAAEWLKAFKVLRDDTKRFKPAWDNKTQFRYIVFYDGDDEEVQCDEAYNYCDSPIAFATEADAKESIKNHEKEWKIFLHLED